MAFRAFYFQGLDGNLLAGLSPSVRILDRTGALQVATTATPRGAGQYDVVVSDALKTLGVIILVDGGPLTLNRYRLAVCADDGLFAVRFENLDGTPFDESSDTPTWGTYLFADGSDHIGAAPAFDALETGAYCTTIPTSHLGAGVTFRVDAPDGAISEFFTSQMSLGDGFIIAPVPIVPDPVPPPSTSVYSHESYTRMVGLLYPPGELFRIEVGTERHKLNQGIADELVRVNQRGADLIEETDPRTATETLPEWEKMLSLPDDVVPVLPGTVEERRVVVAQKYIAQGGQDYAYFTQVCASCGYPLVSIVSGAARLLRVVTGRVLDRLWGRAYAFHIFVTVGPAGVGALTHAQFEAAFRKRLHAGITASFTYT